MGKFTSLQQDIYSVFAKQKWKAEQIVTYPSLMVPDNPGQEYIRVSIVPSSQGINISSVSGILIIDIFAALISGPKRPLQLADTLDIFLVAKSIELSTGTTQFMGSSVSSTQKDKDDPALSMTSYSIPFSYFGVN